VPTSRPARCRRVRMAALGVLVLGACLMVAPAMAAEASTAPCGSLPSGTSVSIDCVVPPAHAPYTTYTDGQQVNLAMGPNTLFTGHDGTGMSVVAIECEYTTGTGPGDPPDANFCSAQTAAEDFPYATHADGSFDYAADHPGDLVPTYALPDATFAAAPIECNTSQPCVWYVGESYNNFTAPHVFSNPFIVTGGTVTTTTAATAPSSSVPATSSPPATDGTTSPQQLAFTGVSPLVEWLAIVGIVMFALGAFGLCAGLEPMRTVVLRGHLLRRSCGD
jgi:hypothetical protein